MKEKKLLSLILHTSPPSSTLFFQEPFYPKTLNQNAVVSLFKNPKIQTFIFAETFHQTPCQQNGEHYNTVTNTHTTPSFSHLPSSIPFPKTLTLIPLFISTFSISLHSLQLTLNFLNPKTLLHHSSISSMTPKLKNPKLFSCRKFTLRFCFWRILHLCIEPFWGFCQRLNFFMICYLGVLGRFWRSIVMGKGKGFRCRVLRFR